MQGHTEIIDALNELLTAEMTSVDQYFLHSRIYEDMGLEKLYTRLDHEREEETEHADLIMRRILFLEGMPKLGKRDEINIGTTVPEMLENDLKLEYSVGAALKKVIALCEQLKDYQTREILEKLLTDTEEDHTYWLEQQLRLIKLVGLENYMQSQMGEHTE